LTGALLVVLWETRRRDASIPVEVAAVTAVAILLSPIAWDHYWTMMFPAFLILYDSSDNALLGRSGRYAFWTAAVLTTGLSPLTLGRSGFNLARDLSVYTIAALIVFASLLVVCARASREQPAAQARTPHDGPSHMMDLPPEGGSHKINKANLDSCPRRNRAPRASHATGPPSPRIRRVRRSFSEAEARRRSGARESV
jgi:hypothetical protein